MWLPHSFIFLLLSASASAAVTNTTIDDSSLSFTFNSGIWVIVTPTSPCPSCLLQPDPSKTHGGTWHDGNVRLQGGVNTSGSFTFTGSAVYIFGIDQAIHLKQADIVFTLGNIEQHHHYTGTEQYVYDVLFFSAQGLASDQTHTVNWVLNLVDASAGTQAALFDYAIVTSGEDDPETTTSEAGTVSSPPLTTPSEAAASSINSLSGNTVSSSPTPSGLGPSQSSGRIIQPNGGTSLSNSGKSQLATTASSDHASSRSAPTPPEITTTAASVGASLRSKSNTGAIVGGAVVAALVVVLGMLFVWRRLGRVRRVKSQDDRVARTRFLRIEDYLYTRQVAYSTPISQSQKHLASNISLPTDGQATITTYADSSRATLESETPAVMDHRYST